MNNIHETCPKCQSKKIISNSQVNPIQNYVPGKDFKFEKYPQYLCEDCSEEFDT